ncbi:transposase Tn3 family protein (plasmid) [Streptomyces sp. GBA 94-10 4N24]|nr:transposase Tn3 family protein [Streptomyces sp. GBA 94-10 4N24]UZN63169.1 transposase Tn3 family protein [Streptomyces sp. GBA 94-10 4N24]
MEVVGGKLKPAKLGKAEEPKLMPPFRQLVNGMLPRVDFPELLLEVAELTGMADAFTHISGADSGMGASPRACARCCCRRRAMSG